MSSYLYKMLRIRLLLFCALLLPLIAIAQPAYTVEAANTAILNKDYPTAITILDSLARSGEAATDLYLALGNAQFEAGKLGAAILAYERGLRIAPGNKDLKNNLRFVREESGIPLTEVPTLFLLRWWTSLGSALGSTVAYALSLLFWWLAVAGLLWWYLYRRKMAEKKRFALLPLAVGAAVVAVALLFLGHSRVDRLAKDDEAILLNPATLRVSPSEEGSIEGELAEGEKMMITDRVNRFVKVRLEDGRQGYLPASDMEVI